MSDEIGDAAVAVPVAGVAGRLADNVTLAVGTGLYTVCVTWIGARLFWLTMPVAGLIDQPFRYSPALLTI